MLDLSGREASPLSRWLAGETAEQHELVEVDLLPEGRVTGFDDVVRLVTVHQRVLAAYAGPADDLVPIAGTAPLAAWLAAADRDLLAWGVPPRPASGSVPASNWTSDYLVGVRYVMEGARMGLRVLANEVATVLADAGEQPSTLLRADPEAGPRWRAVRRWLDDPGHDGIDREQVRGGALDAFDSYRPLRQPSPYRAARFRRAIRPSSG